MRARKGLFHKPLGKGKQPTAARSAFRRRLLRGRGWGCATLARPRAATAPETDRRGSARGGSARVPRACAAHGVPNPPCRGVAPLCQVLPGGPRSEIREADRGRRPRRSVPPGDTLTSSAAAMIDDAGVTWRYRRVGDVCPDKGVRHGGNQYGLGMSLMAATMALAMNTSRQVSLLSRFASAASRPDCVTGSGGVFAGDRIAQSPAVLAAIAAATR